VEQDARFVLHQRRPAQHLLSDVIHHRQSRINALQVVRHAAQNRVQGNTGGNIVVRKKGADILEGQGSQFEQSRGPSVEWRTRHQQPLFHHSDVGSGQNQHDGLIFQMVVPGRLEFERQVWIGVNGIGELVQDDDVFLPAVGCQAGHLPKEFVPIVVSEAGIGRGPAVNMLVERAGKGME
jgi:hypothetical protein